MMRYGDPVTAIEWWQEEGLGVSEILSAFVAEYGGWNVYLNGSESISVKTYIRKTSANEWVVVQKSVPDGVSFSIPHLTKEEAGRGCTLLKAHPVIEIIR